MAISRGESWTRGAAAALAVAALLVAASDVRAQLVTCAGSDAITVDCNGNNTDDYCDINQFATSGDSDLDGIPDECDFQECLANVWGGFEPVPPFTSTAPINGIDYNGDGDAWSNPLGAWTIVAQGCSPTTPKAVKGVVQTPPVTDTVFSEYMNPLEPAAQVVNGNLILNPVLDCGAHKYTFTADFRYEAASNPRADWQLMLKDGRTDTDVILVHWASTQSNFAGVTAAQGGSGRGRIIVQNPAGSPVFINTGFTIPLNTCHRIEVVLDNNAPAESAVSISINGVPRLTLPRLSATAKRIDYLAIRQSPNGQATGNLNRLGMDNAALCKEGPQLPWLDCNGDCVDDAFNIALGQTPDCNATGIPDICENFANCSCDDTPVTGNACIWCNHKGHWGFESADADPNTEDGFNLGAVNLQRGWSAVPPVFPPGADAQVVNNTFGGQFTGSRILRLGALGFGEIAEGAKSPRTRNSAAADGDIEFWEVDVLQDAQDTAGSVFFAVWDQCEDFTGAQFSGDNTTAFDGTPFTAAVRLRSDAGGTREAWLLDGSLTPPNLWRDQGANRGWEINLKKRLIIRIVNTVDPFNPNPRVAYFADPNGHRQGILEGFPMWTIGLQNPAAGGDREAVVITSSSVINAYFDSFKYSTDTNCDHDDLPDSIWLSSTCWGQAPAAADGQFYQACFDLNNNCLPDWCEDCNANARLDSTDISGGTSRDCNQNGIPDECDIDEAQPSYHHSGTAPSGGCIPGGDPQFWLNYSRRGGGSFDCNTNGTPDECETDCNENGLADECDIAGGTSRDLGGPEACAPNGIPDECEVDCNTNGVADACDVFSATSLDCNNNNIPDECDVSVPGADCNANLVPDQCEPDPDCNANGTLDECDAAGNDCNVNGIPDDCDFEELDCNENGVIDGCDIFAGTSLDNGSAPGSTAGDGIPDECQTGGPGPTLLSAAARKANASGPGGFCDLPIDMVAGAPITSEPRNIMITEVRFAYDGAPTGTVTVESDCSCPSPPTYAPIAPPVTCTPSGNTLVCTFTPGLTNACTYRLTVPSAGGSASVELRGLIGDANSDGRVNATDRSEIVAAWTGGGFSCLTDLNSDGATNATDRSLVVAGWTGVGTNCAP